MLHVILIPKIQDTDIFRGFPPLPHILGMLTQFT